MAASQKRMLAAPTSILGKQDIVGILRKEESWAILPEETRRQLYSLLPKPKDGAPPHDPDVHPLKTQYKTYIEEELRRWQEDLKNGREAKKWREEAMQAGKDRGEGKFDEWKEMQREEYWGPPDENDPGKDEVKNLVEVEDSQDEENGRGVEH